ncbi:MAG: M28 family metallopeptidase [Clostridiaceae bacterium]|nr:M28 family metallopeptidase [Clostridiaceae bacterium]
MKKTIYIITTITSLIFFTTCLLLQGSRYDFNVNNLKNNIEYLSSKEFNGRLAGTDENEKIANEIANTFDDYNLKPLNENETYKEPFNCTVPSYNGQNPSIKLRNGENVIKDFEPGKDFKEDGLAFKNSHITFSKDNKIDIYYDFFTIEKDNVLYAFKVNFDTNFSFRSSFSKCCPYGFLIYITTDVFNSILNSIREGNTLEVNLPYTTQEKEINNVAGMIKGYNKELPPLVITAHFDHVGFDSLGNIYYGALDNASGTSFMLELARKFSSIKTPERTIIFVALNAEEMGLMGSQSFASSHKDLLKDAEIINIDMVGAKKTPLTFILGKNSTAESSDLYEDLSDICNNNDINFNCINKDSSDHASFCNNGFDSLTISHCNTTNIHSPRDVPENISTDSLNTVYKILNKEITEHCYDNKVLLLYDKKVLILLSCAVFILVGYGIIWINKDGKED